MLRATHWFSLLAIGLLSVVACGSPESAPSVTDTLEPTPSPTPPASSTATPTPTPTPTATPRANTNLIELLDILSTLEELQWSVNIAASRIRIDLAFASPESAQWRTNTRRSAIELRDAAEEAQSDIRMLADDPIVQRWTNSLPFESSFQLWNNGLAEFQLVAEIVVNWVEAYPSVAFRNIHDQIFSRLDEGSGSFRRAESLLGDAIEDLVGQSGALTNGVATPISTPAAPTPTPLPSPTSSPVPTPTRMPRESREGIPFAFVGLSLTINSPKIVDVLYMELGGRWQAIEASPGSALIAMVATLLNERDDDWENPDPGLYRQVLKIDSRGPVLCPGRLRFSGSDALAYICESNSWKNSDPPGEVQSEKHFPEGVIVKHAPFPKTFELEPGESKEATFVFEVPEEMATAYDPFDGIG